MTDADRRLGFWGLFCPEGTISDATALAESYIRMDEERSIKSTAITPLETAVVLARALLAALEDVENWKATAEEMAGKRVNATLVTVWAGRVHRWKTRALTAREREQRLRQVIRRHYPSVAGRAIALREAGEDNAATAWEAMAKDFAAALCAAEQEEENDGRRPEAT